MNGPTWREYHAEGLSELEKMSGGNGKMSEKFSTLVRDAEK